MRPRYLLRRQNRYYFRARIPSDLRAIFGRTLEYEVSLHTSDPAVAVVRVAEKLQEATRFFDRARRRDLDFIPRARVWRLDPETVRIRNAHPARERIEIHHLDDDFIDRTNPAIGGRLYIDVAKELRGADLQEVRQMLRHGEYDKLRPRLGIAWQNGVRIRIYMERVNVDGEDGGNEDRSVIKVAKTNVSAKTSVSLRFVGGMIVPETAREVAEAQRRRAHEKARRAAEVTEILLDGFRRLSAMKIRVSAKRKSQEALVSLLLKHDLACGASKVELNDAMDRLELTGGVITAADGKYSNGTPYIVVKSVHGSPESESSAAN